MKIYVGHSRSFDYEAELYEPVRAALGVHELILPHVGEGQHDSRAIIPTLDFMIAEVSYPSIGLGIELAWAEHHGVPILALHRADVTPSGSVGAVCKDVRPYASSEEMVEHIKGALNDLET